MSDGKAPTGRMVRNALVKAAVQATRLLSLAFVVLAARVLGPEGFGKFTFAYTLAAMLGAALDLGMHSILVRSIARARADTAAYWAAAVTLKLVLLVPAGILFAALPMATGRPADTTAAVWLLGTAITLQAFTELAVAVFTGFERLEAELGVRIVEKLVLLAVGVTGLALGGRLLAVTGAFVVSGALSLALGAALVNRRFARLVWRWDPAGARGLARALGPVAVAFLLAYTTTRLVPLLVALLAGDLAAGYFGAAVRVLDVVMVVPVIVVAAVYPVLARLEGDRAEFRRVVVRAVEWLLVVGGVVALAFAHGADWLTAVVYGPRYAPAAPALAVLGVAGALGFLSHFLGVVLLALDRPRRLVAVAAISLAASIALTPALVLTLHALGGAVALTLVELVAVTGSLMALIPYIRLPFDTGVVKIASAVLAAVIAGEAIPAAGAARLVIVLFVYGVGLLALRPAPVRLGRRLLRGVSRGDVPARFS
jgi:O-antigen/teichoic acid export membrane protein